MKPAQYEIYYKYVGYSKSAPTLNASICGIILPTLGDVGAVARALNMYLINRIPVKIAPIIKNGKLLDCRRT